MSRYLFGPVASRRFGRSLGVDLLPGKFCSFDCVFCEVGRTKTLTVERGEYVPTADVISELRAWASSGGTADFITLAGSGEPTLHTGFGEVLRAAGALRVARTALLTNGSLMHLPDVQEGAAAADVVKIALGAVSASGFQALNRPHAEVDLGRMIDAGAAFRRRFSGSLWVEVFVVEGVNDDVAVLRPVAERIASWKPDRIHLNTVARPPADSDAMPASKPVMERLAAIFTPRAEVIAEFSGTFVRSVGVSDGQILAILGRRPGRPVDVAAACGLDERVAKERLEGLATRGLLSREPRPDGDYYRARDVR